MPVREAGEADADEVASLIRELAEYEQLAHEVTWSRDGLVATLFGPDRVARVLLAVTDEGAVAGFALYVRNFSTFLGRPGIWLEDLFVREAYRGRGFGRQLLLRLRELSEARVEWSVLDWNEPAIGFYRSLGARPVQGWTTFRWLPDPAR